MSYHLKFKPKWRPIGWMYHCFMKATDGKGYESLCLDHRLDKSGGGKCRRPPALLRCAICDGDEMRLFRVEESLPESRDWRD